MASIWDDIEKSTTEYKTLILTGKVLDVMKFNMISITHHSTRIEGSTLTETETSLLLQEGTTAKGKPIEQHLMVEDHFNALKIVIDLASKKHKITSKLLCQIAAAVMVRTGTIVNTSIGSWDESKGEYRKAAVRSQRQYYVSYDKVPDLVEKLCDQINERIESVKGVREVLELAFTAHFDLVQIHPWSDGNGRTSRLLMNFIEHYHGQPLTIVRSENKKEYIESILQSKDKEDLSYIIEFLAKEHLAYIRQEISLYQSQFKQQHKGEQTGKDQNKGYSLIF